MSIETDLNSLENTKNIKFKVLLKIAEKHFGPFRIKGSHHIFKMPWKGDPRINIQPSEKDKKMAKSYQVKTMVKALEKLAKESRK